MICVSDCSPSVLVPQQQDSSSKPILLTKIRTSPALSEAIRISTAPPPAASRRLQEKLLQEALTK